MWRTVVRQQRLPGLYGPVGRALYPPSWNPPTMRRLSASTEPPVLPADAALSRIRNIGIIAHIDAGKTTTTERMLFLGGYTQRMGEVHDGNTITDFMPQERERGITIKSAAITFGWTPSDPALRSLPPGPGNGKSPLQPPQSPYVINLIDTPGHVDFTVEVERSVRVLDGAVALYDAVSGVEAQSETVWLQAERYGVPRVAFANKMDREGASYEATAASMRHRLGASPLLLHLPLGEAGLFCGFVDLVSCEAVVYGDALGKEMHRIPLRALLEAALDSSATSVWSGIRFRRKGGSDSLLRQTEIVFTTVSAAQGEFALDCGLLIELVAAARESLVSQLADSDEGLADAYLTLSSGEPLPLPAAADLRSGLDGASLALLAEKSAWAGLLHAPPADAAAPAASAVSVVLRELQRAGGAAFGGAPTGSATPGLEPHALRRVVRAATLSPEGGAVPLLCGSSYKNKGVQSLLDAVVAYLPSPLDRGPCVGTDAKTGAAVAVQPTTGAPLRALAFKVQNDAAKGPLVFFRVYSGVLSGRPPLLNVGTGVKERPSKLLQVLADEQREVDAVACGHIAAATGLKSVRTGDTLVLGADPQPVQLQGLTLPQPVFTAALEVDSQSEQKALEEALAVMTREDPSLHAVTNEETGQLLLSGMGELHLDIAVDRLKREYGVPVRLGRMMVAYKEAPAAESIVVTQQYDRTLNKRHWVQLTLEVSRLTREEAAAVAEARSPGAIEVQGEAARRGDKKARKGGKHGAKASESAPGAATRSDSADADATAEEEAEDAVPLLTVFENDESADSTHGRDGAAAAGTGSTRQAQLVCRVLSESVAPGTSTEQVAAMAASSEAAGAAASAAATASGAADDSLKRMPGQLAEAVRAAVAAAVGRGPLMGYPLAGTKIRLVEEECVISPDTTPTAIRACINACVAAAFKDGGAELLEPVMAVEVSVPGASVGAITSDVTAQRRGRIREITTAQVQAQSAVGGVRGGSGGSAASAVHRDKVIIRAHVPLRQMVGYSTQLRSQTAGEGGFSMQFSHYAPVGATLQAQLIADPMLA